MILAMEMNFEGTVHATGNGATILALHRAFPGELIRIMADPSHLDELRRHDGLRDSPRVEFHPIQVSRHYRYRPQVVSVRRGMRELWTLLKALVRVPAGQGCLVVFLSTTPTAVALAALLARLLPARICVYAGFHGDLNSVFGWRTANPLFRMIDLHAALSGRHGSTLRFFVLEDSIRRALSSRLPGAARTTDVLTLPIPPAEAANAQPNTMSSPLRFGLVGQATEAKGIKPFLELANAFAQSHPAAVSFHVVGNAPASSDPSLFSVLGEPVPTGHIPRAEFLRKLGNLHYVCLLLEPKYYEMSASGALLDAVTWLRPVIATRLPVITDLFDRFGDIGELCDDNAAAHAAIARLADNPDPARYQRQVDNLRRARQSRMPDDLARDYARVIEGAFPGLLGDRRATAAGAAVHAG